MGTDGCWLIRPWWDGILSLGKLMAAEAWLVNNFVWNPVWTFRELAGIASGWCQQRLVCLLKFNLGCAAGMELNVILLNKQVYCRR